MPGARCARSLAGKKQCRTSNSPPRVHRNHPAFPAQWFTAYFVLSPVIGYSIHTFWSLRVVPYLMRRKASRPNRITIGPGFP
jgi:hypothetical protein